MLLYEELSSQEQRLVRAMARTAYYCERGMAKVADQFPHVGAELHTMAGQLLDALKCGDIAIEAMTED